MTDRRFRVLAVASHPVQYMAPLFRRMAKHSSLDFQAAYCTLRGAEGGHDPEFDANVQWDVPLLDGYAWSHVPNRGSGKETFLSLLNPGLWKLIRSGNFDAVLCFIGYVRTSFWIACLAAKFSNAAFLFGTDATTLASRDGRAWKTRITNILWPRTFNGMQPYEDFVLNAYLWLLLGILFRLPTLALSAQYAAAAQTPQTYSSRMR